MKICGSLLVWLALAVGASSVYGQAPLLSTLEAPYAPLQMPVKIAGSTYASGTVAYGPPGTPLVLSGSGLGDNGTVWFVSYKNGAVDSNTSPALAAVTLWSANQIFLKVPSNAVSGLVEVVVGGKVSNGLPFMVTTGAYAASCPTGPTATQLQITTDTLPSGAVGKAYSTQLAATGGSGSYTWSLASGSLPSSLSLSSSGVISGTPSSAGGQVSFTVQVLDTSNPQQHDESTLDLQIAQNPEGSSGIGLYSFSVQASGGGAEGYDAVGNVTAYTDSVNGSWSFTYDSLNRLATAAGSQADNPYPNACWQYDAFGNRLSQTTSVTAYTSQNGGANSCPVSSGPNWWAQYGTSNTNRMDSTSLNTNQSQYYDAAGDVTNDGITAYLYDGEGRVCAVQQTVSGLTSVTEYLYDAEGRRVAKGANSSFTCSTSGFTATNVYVLDLNGQQMTEMVTNGAAWQWAHTNVSASGLSATYDADLTGKTAGPLYFHLSDWLGTRRQQTDYAGNPLLNFTGLPYGDGLNTIAVTNSDAPDATEQHFTGKERDAESGNDYFGARYYASSMGRWMSPDPSMESEILEVPQTWNRYSYVYNRPLYGTDPDGRCPPCVGALIGGVVGGISEGGFSAVSQYLQKGSVDWGEVGANAAGGAVSGAITGGIAGATGGLSLLGDAALGAGANAVGGEVTRLIEGKDTSASDVVEDAVAGYAGGVGGHIAADLVHIPSEPKAPNNLKSYLKMKKYNAKVFQRNVAKGIQTGVGTATGTPPAHSVSGVFWLFDLFGNVPPPPPPPPAPCATTSATDSQGNSTGTSGCQ